MSYKISRFFIATSSIIVFLSSFLTAQAQQYKVTGQAVSLEDFTPIPHVLVTVLSKDSVSLKSVKADDNGEFVLYMDKKGEYIAKSSMIGFKPRCQLFKVTGRTTVIPLLKMEEDNLLLDSVTVTGNLPKVQQVEDTLIYNADAYRLPDGSVLEELIERLPGAEVEDGKVTING